MQTSYSALTVSSLPQARSAWQLYSNHPTPCGLKNPCRRSARKKWREWQDKPLFQLALGRVGGILEAKKIAALAEANYAQIAPHLYCGPVEGVANIHLAACCANFLILESIEDWTGFHNDLLTSPINWQDGYIAPSTEPGLGIELNEEVALNNPYKEDALHLQPQAKPYLPYFD